MRGFIRKQYKESWDIIRDIVHQTELMLATRSACRSGFERHRTVLHSALKAAQQPGLVQRNMASPVIGKPHPPEGYDDVLQPCREGEEARHSLPQPRS